MTSAAAHLQDNDQMREYAERLLECHDDFRIGEMRGWPLKRTGDWQHFVAGLRAAGLPE
jgi:hypothetical protein